MVNFAGAVPLVILISITLVVLSAVLIYTKRKRGLPIESKGLNTNISVHKVERSQRLIDDFDYVSLVHGVQHRSGHSVGL